MSDIISMLNVGSREDNDASVTEFINNKFDTNIPVYNVQFIRNQICNSIKANGLCM